MKILHKVFIITIAVLFCSATILLNKSHDNNTLVLDINANTDKQKISEYTTKFNKNSPGRKENIRLAAKAINQKIIRPTEVFSFNDTVGPTNKENGYKLSYIFIKGKKKKGYGGGACQVSSTLYNALLGADLEVIERHSHTGDVFYVPANKDAATSYGSVDLKFKNNKDYSIEIISYIYQDTITVAIYKCND
jgi:vancomycin resistance protein YoaR